MSTVCKTCNLSLNANSSAKGSRLRPQASQNLQTFTLFPKLATELRLKIWQLAASEPRQIKLYILSPEDRHPKSKVQTRAPAIMHTCRESREEGKRFYTICIERGARVKLDENREVISVPAFPIKSMVWVNFKIDRFDYKAGHGSCFRDFRHEGFNFRDPVLDHIQQLALVTTHEAMLISGLRELAYNCYLAKSARYGGQLKQLTIIHKIKPMDHFVGCPEVKSYKESIRKEISKFEQRRMWNAWKVPTSIEWEGESKPWRRRSQNPSVVTGQGKMIWQSEETVVL